MTAKNNNSRKMFIAFAILMFCLGISDALRGVFSGVFSSALSYSDSKIGLLVTVSYIGNLSFLFFGGYLAKVFSRKKMLLFLLSIWIFAQALFAFTEQYIFLVIGMFLAMGTSTLLNTTMNLITSVVYTGTAVFMVNALYFIQGIGTSGSQFVLGNFIEGIRSWHYTTLVLLIIGVIVGILLIVSSIPGDEEKSDAKEKVSFKRVAVNPFFIILVLIFGTYFIAEHGMLNWFVRYATQGLDVPDGTAAAYVSLFFGGITVGRLVLSKIGDKIGPFQMIMIFGLISVVLFTIGYLGGKHTLLLMALSGISFSVIYPTLVLIISRLWKKEEASAASGIIISVASLADIGFNMVFGSLTELAGYRTAFAIMPISMIVCTFLLVIFCRKARRTVE